MSSVPRLTVYGSCVSRDAASVLEGRGWSVERYIARQSLISAGSSVDVSHMDLSGLTSAFVRRSLLSDAAGDLEAQLAKVADRTDILLWDLTDERLGVIEAAPECFLTRSTEGMTARLYEWAGDRLLELGTDGHLHQWERALPRFRAVLERCGLLERTVLLNAPWALRTAAGEPTVSSWGLTAQEANCMIAEYVEEVCKELPVPVLRVPDELVVADTRHRWGSAPFHYLPDFYKWVTTQVEAMYSRSAQYNTSVTLSVNSKTRAAIPRGTHFNHHPLEQSMLDLEPGDSTVTLSSGKLRVRYKPSTTDRSSVLVVFSGIRPHATVDFSGASSEVFRNDIIWIYDEFGEASSSTYYIAEQKSLTPAARIYELITRLAVSWGISLSDFVFAGFSKGASAALYHGLRLNVGGVVAVAPQIRIASYARTYWPTIHATMTSGDMSFSNFLDKIIIRQIEDASDHGSRTPVYLITSRSDIQYSSELAPVLSTMRSLPHFNLITTDSPLVTQHIDVTPYNVPVTQGILLLLLDGITPDIGDATNGRSRDTSPPARPDEHTSTANLLSVSLRGPLLFPIVDTFIQGSPVTGYGQLERFLHIGTASHPLSCLIDKRASWRNFGNHFVDYSGAKSISFKNQGINISYLPTGHHDICASLATPGSTPSQPVPVRSPQERWSTSRLPDGRLAHVRATDQRTQISILDLEDIAPEPFSALNTLRTLEPTSDMKRLRIEGTLAAPGVVATGWGDVNYLLFLTSESAKVFYSLGRVDRTIPGIPDTLRRANFADIQFKGVPMTRVNDGTHLIEVILSTPSVVARSSPIGQIQIRGGRIESVKQLTPTHKILDHTDSRRKQAREEQQETKENSR